MLDFKFILKKTNAIVVSILALLIWGGICFQISSGINQKFDESEKNNFQIASVLLKEKVESYVHGLQGMGGFVIARNFIPTNKEVRDYALFRNKFQNFPGALGFGFIRIVKHEDLNAFSKSKKAETELFNFKQISPYEGDHFIIEAIEPIETNRFVLGLDVASEGERKKAAIEAMKKAAPTLTAPIELVQSRIKHGGFLYYLPVYKTIVPPKTIDERKNNIVGWSYCPIKAAELLSYLKSSVNTRFIYSLEDVTNPELPILILSSAKNDDQIVQKDFQENLSIGGRTWKFTVQPQNTQRKMALNILNLLFFIIGATLSILLLIRLRNYFIQQDIMEKKYEDIESWKGSVLNETIYSMIATKVDGTITIFNKAAENILGYSADEVINKLTPQVFHDESEVIARNAELENEFQCNMTPGFETFVAKAKIYDKPDINEWTYINKSGARIPVRLSITTIKDSSNNITGYLGVAENISEQKVLQSKIEEQKLQMVHSSKMSALGEMAGGIAHEINNPLAVISGRSMIIQTVLDADPVDSKLISEQLKSIDSTVTRISKIIKGLKNFSRESSNDEKEYTSVSSILNDTLDLCKERFHKNEISINITIKDDLKIWCRPVEISQVLMNLMMNSFDAIVDQEGKRRIDIEISKISDICLISVTDSGNGIPPEVAAKIMEPFFSTKDVGKGTGLGLSISQGIVESHQGRLYLDMNNQNTQFKIELPI